MTGLLALAARYIGAPAVRFGRWLLTERAGNLFLLGIFLVWRIIAIDADRDNWRDLAREYEAASKIVEAADKAADAEALDVASETVKGIEDGNARAKSAADASDDGLRAAFDELRPKGARKGD